MTRPQIWLTVGGILAAVLIYQLPRVVVENETDESVEVEAVHDFSISATDATTFSSLRQLLKVSTDNKKSVNFADSLAQLHLKYQQIDSAIAYATVILETNPDNADQQKAALIYYQAFQMSPSQEQALDLAKKARAIFEQLLVADQQNNFLKNKLAMTLMTTENPMAGVQLLREVLADDPENREATLNLGLLAIRSGQYDRAKERFEFLLKLDSTDFESLFYYGVSLAESGEKENAKTVLEKIVNHPEVDEALKATAASYIKEL